MDRETLRRELSGKLRTPGDRAAMAWMTHVASIVHPALGGFVGAADSIRKARSKAEADKLLLQWMENTSTDLAALEVLMQVINAQPDEASRASLLAEVLGADLAMRFLHGKTGSIGVMLHSATVEELQAYVRLGMLDMSPTHSQMNMGAGNQIGGHIEELKRPHGTGTGFIIGAPN